MREKPTFADLLAAARTGPDEHFYKVLKAYEEPEPVYKPLDTATLRALIWVAILIASPLVFIGMCAYSQL